MEARATPDPAGRSPIDALFDRHVDEVYRYVFRRCRDQELAEDITQDVFVRAVRSLDDPGSVGAGWLIQVAHNRLVDLLRRNDRYRTKLRLLQGGTSSVAEPDLSTAERIDIEQALGELSVDHRLVLTLHYLDGHTVPELADLLDRTPKSVEGLITRARRQLRNLLEDTDA